MQLLLRDCHNSLSVLLEEVAPTRDGVALRTTRAKTRARKFTPRLLPQLDPIIEFDRVTETVPITAPEAAHRAKPPVELSVLEHRNLRDGEFWRAIPKYAQVDEATFLDHIWQGRNSVQTPDELFETIAGLADPSFIEDAREGFRLATMAVRVSPYLIASIDWSNPWKDPLRRQFIPLRSTQKPDHPRLTLDSLHEQEDAPVPGLVHRYFDRALFLPLQTCPVYCRFCTRSYAIGPETGVGKLALGKTPADWRLAFDYVSSRPEIEDIVISGGDTYQLSARNITAIGDALLAIPHVRRMRFATKGLAVMPMKVLTDPAWFDAFAGVVERGRAMGKDVFIHTHFNHPNEITAITRRAIEALFRRGVHIRNQSVLIRGVNDDPATMTCLIRRLGFLNIHPYYVFMHDLVRGVEDLRTSVQAAIDLEKAVRGATSGYHMPTFVTDTPGGGGKRDVHSYEHYDRENGIVIYTAPAVKRGRYFLYVDPIDTLSPAAQQRWADPARRNMMIANAVARAGGDVSQLA